MLQEAETSLQDIVGATLVHLHTSIWTFVEKADLWIFSFFPSCAGEGVYTFLCAGGTIVPSVEGSHYMLNMLDQDEHFQARDITEGAILTWS